MPKKYIITISDPVGMDDERKIKAVAANIESAMVQFLWWQLNGVSIKEVKGKKKSRKRRLS